MNLIERYVSEVGKYLPRKNRLDIETELRSTLEDMLEDRSQQAEGQVDDALIEELLQEYGAPRKVAATYQTHPYLIGPSIFPTYTLVLKIVLAAVTLGLTIATLVSLINSDLSSPEILKAVGGLALNLLGALAAAFGNLTLVFALLERVLPASEFEDVEEWKATELTKAPDPNQVKTGEMIVSVVFTVLGLIILNFYQNIIGVWVFENGGEWIQSVKLSEAFFRYLPWINLNGALTIVLNIFLLRKGTWQEITRWMHIGIELIAIGIVIALLRGPALLTTVDTSADSTVGFPLTHLLNNILPIALVVVVIMSAIEIVKNVLPLLPLLKVRLTK